MSKENFVEEFVERFKEIVLPYVSSEVKDQIESDRFPYTLHHDWIRKHFPNLSRADVARIAWNSLKDDGMYAVEVIGGACAYILSEYAEEILSHILSESDPTEVIKTYQYMRRFALACNIKIWSQWLQEATQ